MRNAIAFSKDGGYFNLESFDYQLWENVDAIAGYTTNFFKSENCALFKPRS
ncbi:hypothetical protein [Okeania sp. SIO3I5]|uniref:hypothetical protein n=1 Tax=Okeania sp. SIO3I5 TaxID=2607805 RepID=UPI0025F921F4|nr:hypothetical protein [Okeania sp. SIO3I5]